MLFPTIRFAIFFAIVLPTSWLLLPRPMRWRLFIVAASFFFYASWNVNYMWLLAASIIGNELFAVVIDKTTSARARRVATAIAVVANLAALGWYKYAGFFAESGGNILRWFGIDWQPPIPNLLLPVGISFFTFQALSYVLDVSRRRLRPVPLLDFAVYLSFFPHLVAGPIVRASEFLPQLRHRRDPRAVDASLAFWLISVGLFKKVVIASYLAENAVDPLFGFPQQHGGLEALIGVYAYAIQIYADFSGYTDMAIGLALLLGFRFPANFDAPYTATSLQDFWRRWHMTLSRWLRDYLYIPLGGSRRGRRRMYFNLGITMVLGGLWHGAAWTFVVWGALHGGGLAVERLWDDRRRVRRSADGDRELVMVGARPVGSMEPIDVVEEWVPLFPPPPPPPPPPSAPLAGGTPVFTIRGVEVHAGPKAWLRRVAVFHVVCLGWIFFRSSSIGEAFEIVRRIIFHSSPDSGVNSMVVFVVAASLLSQFVPTVGVHRLQAAFSRWSMPAQAAALASVLLLVDVLGPTGVAPFIYFQF